jgi:hypothetical protein
MALTPQSPNPGDSNSVLEWKYAINCHLIAADAGVTSLPPPKLGSSENALLKSALDSILSFS